MRLPQVKSFRDRNQVVVGAVGLLGVAVLVAAAFAFGTVKVFEHRYSVSATFDRTGGLETGADVRVAGVAVGTVTGIHPDFSLGQIVVELDVDHDIRLGVDTTAEIDAATLLGGYYLRLDGPVVAPFLGDLPASDPRRHIPLERTQGPVSLNQVLGDTTATVSAIDFKAANQVITDLANGASHTKDDLPTLIDSFATISAALAARDSDLRQLATNAAAVTQTVASKDQELAGLVDAAHTLLDQLAQRRDELSTLLGSGSDAVARMNALLSEHRAALDATLTDLQQLTARLADTVPAVNTSLAYAATSFPLIAGTLSPSGGFSVRGEGLLVSPGQILGVEQTVQQLLQQLGIQP